MGLSNISNTQVAKAPLCNTEATVCIRQGLTFVHSTLCTTTRKCDICDSCCKESIAIKGWTEQFLNQTTENGIIC